MTQSVHLRQMLVRQLRFLCTADMQVRRQGREWILFYAEVRIAAEACLYVCAHARCPIQRQCVIGVVSHAMSYHFGVCPGCISHKSRYVDLPRTEHENCIPYLIRQHRQVRLACRGFNRTRTSFDSKLCVIFTGLKRRFESFVLQVVVGRYSQVVASVCIRVLRIQFGIDATECVHKLIPHSHAFWKETSTYTLHPVPWVGSVP